MVRAEYWGKQDMRSTEFIGKNLKSLKKDRKHLFSFWGWEKMSTWWPKVAISNSASFNIFFIKFKCWSCYGPHLVQLLSHVWLFATSWTPAHQSSLSITNSRNLIKLMSIELVMPSNHLILCCPLLLQPSIFPSIRVFSN